MSAGALQVLPPPPFANVREASLLIAAQLNATGNGTCNACNALQPGAPNRSGTLSIPFEAPCKPLRRTFALGWRRAAETQLVPIRYRAGANGR